MHKLIEYVCDELEELERKADKEHKLSMAEVQYADTLAHLKKNLLKSDEMMDDGEYSGRSYRYDYDYDDGMSMSMARGRNARRDAMGRYSSAKEDIKMELRNLMNDAPDHQTKQDIERIVNRLDRM